MNSALSIPRTCSCALDTFLEKKKHRVCFFPHLSNLAVTIEFTKLLFSTYTRYCWNYCHFISCLSCFRPEVSLRIIVNCNVNRQGSEMADHVQRIGLVFTLSPKGGTRASECIECSEKFLFLFETFQIDSNNQTC